MSEQHISASREIDAPASAIFAVIADASRHPDFDGSGTVRSSKAGLEPLTLGSKFGMNMRLGPMPYSIVNTVVEFEPDQLIAWRHMGGHRWRYELEPLSDNSTRVTESFDWSTAPLPMRVGYEVAGIPQRNQRAMESTLDRLAELMSG